MFVYACLPLGAEETNIMGMPSPQTVTTIEQLLELPEDELRHELLDGTHVVTPAPGVHHQVVVSRLLDVMKEAVQRQSSTALVLSSPADVVLNPKTLVQPDLFVVDPGNPIPTDWRELPTPLLVVEVLSPNTAVRDRGEKRRLYLESGVEEYWIVDIDARLIERWSPGDARPEIAHGTFEWKLSNDLHGAVRVPDLFERLAYCAD